jgi:hypothetical protein
MPTMCMLFFFIKQQFALLQKKKVACGTKIKDNPNFFMFHKKIKSNKKKHFKNISDEMVYLFF